jgi:hypothetical protein
MSLTQKSLLRWTLAGIATVLSALLTAAGSEAWGLFGRVATLEANDKSNHELLLDVRADQKEMRQDMKEVLRKVDRLP